MTRRPSSRLLLAIAAVLLFCSILVYRSLYSHEQLLFNQLSAFAKTVDGPDPRPDLVTRLSPEDVPILLKWLEAPDTALTFETQFTRGMNSFADSLGFSRAVLPGLTLDKHPPSIALIGFHILGSNAASALPKLQQLAIERSTSELALSALRSIGEPSFNVALEFCEKPQPHIRAKGVYLLRALRIHPPVSVPILLKLLDDPNEVVRTETCTELAEFPGPDVESALIPRLLNLDRPDWRDAAYALHTGSTNALLQLLDLCVTTTNTAVQAATLSALSSRDAKLLNADHEPPRDARLYPLHRRRFDTVHLWLESITKTTRLHLDQVTLIKSNILAGQPARAAETLLPHLKTEEPRVNRPTHH